MCRYKKFLFLTAATAMMTATVLSTAFAAESTALQSDAVSETAEASGTLSDADIYYLASAAFCKAHGLQVPQDIQAGADEVYKNHAEAAAAYLKSMAAAGTGTDESVSADTAYSDTQAGVNSVSEKAAAEAGEATARYIEQEDGSALFFTVDPLTGEALEAYNGWYTLDSGEKTYFENGKMQAGWIIDDGKFYYLDPSTGIMVTSKFAGNFYLGEDGAALLDTTTPDGVKLAYNGSRMTSGTPVEELNEKTYTYRDLLVKKPDLYAEFSARESGSFQLMPEKEHGFSWYTYASMKLYERKEDGSMGKQVYEGDGCFRTDAVIEVKHTDGSISTISPSDIIGSEQETWIADHIHIDPAGFISYSAAQR